MVLSVAHRSHLGHVVMCCTVRPHPQQGAQQHSLWLAQVFKNKYSLLNTYGTRAEDGLHVTRPCYKELLQ
eukprot:2775562-Amphidinium_carterae.1